MNSKNKNQKWKTKKDGFTMCPLPWGGPARVGQPRGLCPKAFRYQAGIEAACRYHHPNSPLPICFECPSPAFTAKLRADCPLHSTPKR